MAPDAVHSEIENQFAFAKYKIVLDWYHLVKKFKEMFSMAFKGRDASKEYLEAVKPLLWRGDANGAIALMANVDEDKIKDKKRLDYLDGYLNRARPHIPNRALRASLGLGKLQRHGRKGQRPGRQPNDKNTTACLGQKRGP
jgi:hypothetical protein